MSKVNYFQIFILKDHTFILNGFSLYFYKNFKIYITCFNILFFGQSSEMNFNANVLFYVHIIFIKNLFFFVQFFSYINLYHTFNVMNKRKLALFFSKKALILF